MSKSLITTLVKSDMATTMDRLRAYALEEINEQDLSETELKQYDRWRVAFSFMRKLDDTEEVLLKLKKAFPEISERTLYRDMKNAKKLWGDVNKVDKEGERYLLAEVFKKGLKAALELKDLKSFAAIGANLIKVQGLDKDDPEMPDFTKLMQHEIIINLHPEVLKQLVSLLSSGSLNLVELLNNPPVIIEDVKHQEVKDEN